MAYKSSSKASKSSSGSFPREVPSQKIAPRDLKSVNPNVEQFEPTHTYPVRQRARMAGECGPQKK